MSDFDKDGKLSDVTVQFDTPRDVFGAPKKQVASKRGIVMLDEGYVMLAAMKDKWNK